MRPAQRGGPPAFPTDFAAAIDNLARAVGTQQDSRAARSKARGAIGAALNRGSRIVADLDVSVPVNLRTDPGRLAEWFGARRMDQRRDDGSEAPPVTVAGSPNAVETRTAAPVSDATPESAARIAA